jgi:FAD:protein FMN transferase
MIARDHEMNGLRHVTSVVALLLLTACSGYDVYRPVPKLVERSRVSMGSQLRVAAWTTNEARAVDTFEHVFREFDRLESLLSVWKDGSDVVRINNNAGITPVKVSQDTINVLRIAREAGDLTGGKFDITFGVLTDIWRFDHDQDNIVPDRDLIETRLKRIDYKAVEVDSTAGTAFINRPGMRIHLGGIGKGYAVDRAVALLKDQGFKDFLIQSGGDLYVAGTDNGKPWKLGIADPRGNHDAFATLQISDGTFSTSGDYERSFMKDGKRYHHLIDPDFGEPARECRSVTIVSNRAVMADVLSTGVFIMGPRRGMELIEKLPDVEGIIVTAENEVLVSGGLKGRIELLKQPTDAP